MRWPNGKYFFWQVKQTTREDGSFPSRIFALSPGNITHRCRKLYPSPDWFSCWTVFPQSSRQWIKRPHALQRWVELKGTPDDLSKRQYCLAAQLSCVKVAVATEVGEGVRGAALRDEAPDRGTAGGAAGTSASTPVAIEGMVPGQVASAMESASVSVSTLQAAAEVS